MKDRKTKKKRPHLSPFGVKRQKERDRRAKYMRGYRANKKRVALAKKQTMMMEKHRGRFPGGTFDYSHSREAAERRLEELKLKPAPEKSYDELLRIQAEKYLNAQPHPGYDREIAVQLIMLNHNIKEQSRLIATGRLIPSKTKIQDIGLI